MTPRELVYYLQNELFKKIGDEAYNYSTLDLLYYLNKSQITLIKNKLQLFEKNQYITDELRSLEKSLSIVPEYKEDEGKFIAKLPNDYNILIKHKCRTKKLTLLEDSDCLDNSNVKYNGFVPGILVRQDEIGLLKKDPFWTPLETEPLYYISGDNIIYEVKEDLFSIEEVVITYFKKESEISIKDVNSQNDKGSNLPGFIHDELINMSLIMILGSENNN